MEKRITKTTVTLCLLAREKEILLAMKKRGFGKGRWNGFGGKLNPGEDLLSGAVRELREESGIEASETDLERIGEIDFFFDLKPEWDQKVVVYMIRKWKGVEAESEEMKPQWFSLEKIPYEDMWPADRVWMPKVLSGEKILGEIVFSDLEGNPKSINLKTL